MKALAKIHLANGALRLSSLHVPAVTVSSEKDLGALEQAQLGPNRCGVFTAHQMGGCRMGSDPERSVVNPELRHHLVENLFVADGSVFPTGLGVNPMESIYAVSSWAAQHVRSALARA
jgi:choline dehydrogenase-like flavoprotein